MNVKLRKDGWTNAEDILLQEIVLKKKEQGLTQMSGFEEASVLLGRSKQACAFRWNKNLRPFLVKGETSPKDTSINEISDLSSVKKTFQQAIESYNEMIQSYDQISHEYNLLKRDYEQLVTWVKQGIKHIE